MNPNVSEIDLQNTVISFLKINHKNELAEIISNSIITYEPQYEFSGIILYQKKLIIKIRVPMSHLEIAKAAHGELWNLLKDIYINDDGYALTSIEFGIKPMNLETIKVNDEHVLVEKDSVYATLLNSIITKEKISELHKKYLIESCNSGRNGNILSATMMLGCAGEISLLELTKSYSDFYKENKSENEYNRFLVKVVNAKTAYARLDEFSKRARIDKDVFNKIGVENIESFLSIFEVIRKSRNDVGHPTGDILSKESLETLLSAYSTILDQYIILTQHLPNYKVD